MSKPMVKIRHRLQGIGYNNVLLASISNGNDSLALPVPFQVVSVDNERMDLDVHSANNAHTS